MSKDRFCNFSIRLSKHEKQLVMDAAEADRRSVADFIRLCIFDKLAANGKDGVKIVTRRVSGFDRTSMIKD